MIKLTIDKVINTDIKGLATRKPLLELSKKRLTVPIRNKLKKLFPEKRITVKCDIKILNDKVVGICTIDKIEHNYYLKSIDK